MRKRIRSEKGFTLLEMIIAVFLLVLVAAVVFPSFTGLADRGISADARAVASIVRYLNDGAHQTGVEREMHVELDGKAIRYQGDRGERTKEIRTLHSVELASTGLRNAGDITVRFAPPGLAEKLTVRLDDGAQRRDIVYNPYSGRIRIEEGSGREDDEEQR